MPALKPTHYTAEIVWLGSVMTDDRNELLSPERAMLDLTFGGVAGAFHAGLTRESCSRVKSQYPKGTQIKNERQLSIVSQEEIDLIAAELGVETLDPRRLGATMVVKGIPDFTHIPPSSRLQAPSGATLTVDMENRPCQFPAKSLVVDHGDAAKAFKPAAKNLRGVCAWVAAEGRMAVGDTLTLHIPDQPAWAP
ncbi:MOSC domain-containing protein [Octadecabacter ascidiaceicola]|uniref:Putative metal-sulfur cluster biosynthesis proteins YuaD n=1 Tax=Octadecabacter ascidiaceicola TaxID=1655543 RepID=A0A238K4X6_9RHOB|nr:MOSC domain-containing protein [Octadecabacter ascidiaceicola]SMX36996.1 Putative metal-sulfur cluster biosynthesis proteins YuaD [Octadecabacter ascidiaceicola]